MMSVPIGEGKVVRHYIAGGTEHGGGIGRLVGYVRAAPSLRLRHELTDTRGESWNKLRSPLILLGACATLLRDRILRPATIHQFHIAGRGSTARKVILGLLAQAVGARYILHLHDYDYADDFNRRPDWQQGLIRRVFQRARHVIALGERDRGTVRDLLGVPRERVSVLRNCVPDPRPEPRDAPSDPVRIVFLGMLGPRKGVPELLAAFSDPAMPADGWQATLAGGGPVKIYRDEVAARGLEDRVDLPGWLDGETTQKLCAAADILVLPSHAEGFAMAILEGLAHGLAVVATRVGAHEEVLEHDRNCLFVPVGDAAALAKTLAALIADPALRARLSAEARRTYLSEFGMEGYVRKLEGLHDAVGQERLGALRAA